MIFYYNDKFRLSLYLLILLPSISVNLIWLTILECLYYWVIHFCNRISVIMTLNLYCTMCMGILRSFRLNGLLMSSFTRSHTDRIVYFLFEGSSSDYCRKTRIVRKLYHDRYYWCEVLPSTRTVDTSLPVTLLAKSGIIEIVTCSSPGNVRSMDRQRSITGQPCIPARMESRSTLNVLPAETTASESVHRTDS